MKEKFIKFAKVYAKEGFTTIPVDKNKQPALSSWHKFQTRPMDDKEIEEHFSGNGVSGIALLTGGVNKITALDFDLKYDLTGNLLDRYKRKVPIELLKKMLVNSTKNNGYHFVYQCDVIEGNQKLAQRETTEEEIEQIYNERKPIVGVKQAMLEATRDKVRVLIETRGGTETKSGGYIVIPPTEGYKKLAGKLTKITPEEYEILTSAAREFNEYETRNKRLVAAQQGLSKEGESPFDAFNRDGNILSILLQNGWKEVRQYSADVRLKRPGATHSSSSALLDTKSNLLNVFTTSSELEVGTHSASDVFIQLEANGDVKKAYRMLLDLGYVDTRNNNK